MADVFSKEMRSYVMSRIKGKDTKPEILVRKFLHKRGFRFRLHLKHIPGTPDLFLKKYKTAIFVHGCFWHGHTGCKTAHIPKTRPEYWKNKIDRNVFRDKDQETKLKQQGYNVIVVWECELGSNSDTALFEVIKKLKSSSM